HKASSSLKSVCVRLKIPEKESIVNQEVDSPSIGLNRPVENPTEEGENKGLDKKDYPFNRPYSPNHRVGQNHPRVNTLLR
ncbi:MAG: hypothetical protein V1800_11700, partial [Candidatus Latescibacterota bacterium]